MGILGSLFKPKQVPDLPAYNENIDLPPPPPPDQQMIEDDKEFLKEEGIGLPPLGTPPDIDESVGRGALRIEEPEKPIREEPADDYVELEEFLRVVDSTTAIKLGLKKIEESVARMHEVRSEQEKLLEKWRQQLEDAQRKLVYVDKTLFRTIG
jgi:hypothetical protein